MSSLSSIPSLKSLRTKDTQNPKEEGSTEREEAKPQG